MEYNIDGVNIPYDKEWPSIAVSLSGGADSALLAYLLCSLAVNENPNLKIHIISHIRMWKTRPWQEYDSKNVYEYLTKKFPTFEWTRHVNFIAPDIEYGATGPVLMDEYGKKVSGDNIQIRAYSEYVCYHNKISAYYNGVTRNPKNKNFDGMKERDIDPTEFNQHLRLMKHMNVYAIHPFRFIEKHWVIQQYRKRNLLDLFSITRSCEGEFEGITYETYIPNQHVPTCDICFWCKERNWAISNAM